MLGQMSDGGRTAGVGMLQSFVCMTGNGSEEVLTCAEFTCSNLQWGGGKVAFRPLLQTGKHPGKIVTVVLLRILQKQQWSQSLP